MAESGASIVVDYVGKAEIAQGTIDQIRRRAARRSVWTPTSQPDDVATLIQKTVEAFGKLDIFVNNAGIEKKFAFVDYPLEEWQKIMAVNLTGPFLCSQAAAKQMIAQGNGGRIINISSIHEDLPLLTNASYCASKGGLRMLMRTIAVELAPHKITLNNIGPGAIYTPIDKDVEENKAMNEAILAEIPLGRWGPPEEIGDLAVFLASDKVSYITGSKTSGSMGLLIGTAFNSMKPPSRSCLPGGCIARRRSQISIQSISFVRAPSTSSATARSRSRSVGKKPPVTHPPRLLQISPRSSAHRFSWRTWR